MMNYSIKRLDINEIDLIQPLWEQLNLLHSDLSLNFKHRFHNMNWEKRKTKLMDKSAEILIDVVVDGENRAIGYCVSTIDKENPNVGEIDSIYIDESCRESGLGKQLINNAIGWLIEKETTEQQLLVGIGNEKVLEFYKQFHFYPRHIVLQRID